MISLVMKGDLAMETLGCNIVDTYFHTSARIGTIGPNKLDFLLHERGQYTLSCRKTVEIRGSSHLREPSFESKTLHLKHSQRNKPVIGRNVSVEGQIFMFLT